MAAGTVISGGFPGRVAREVQPNQKCEGCLHYDRQAGRTGACAIGDSPWKCGGGDAPDIGYAPIARGAGSYLPDMSNHGAHAPEVDPQHVGGLYGAGSTRPVEIRQVSLGEEHVHIVKSMVTRHAELQKSQCLLCSMRGAHGITPPNAGPQACTCSPLDAVVVAKAVVSRMSNAQLVGVRIGDVAEWVRSVAKAGFKLPSRARGFGPRVVDSERRAENRGENKPKRSLSDQVHIDGNGGHLRPIEKGSFSKLGHHAVHLTGVAHADGTSQAHARALDAHKKAAAEGGPKASFHEQHVTYHQSQIDTEKGSLYHPVGRYDISPAGGGNHHVDLHPRSGGEPVRVGTFSSPGKARHEAIAHAGKLASGSGGKIAPSTSAPTRKIRAAGAGSASSESVEKAIDNAVHSHVVTGKLAPHGVGYSGRKAASSAVDRLDKKYGASSHTAARNPDYKPKTLKWEKTSAYGAGGHTAEAGHGSYVHEPQPHGQHVVTYYPRGTGKEGALHGGSHSSPGAAHAAAQAHHQKTIGE